MKPAAQSITSMKRSGIREIMDLAWQHPEVLHLEYGEPNFPTPDHIIEAAGRAAADGFTKYTPNRGLPEVREAMARKIAERNRFEVDVDQIVVTTGAVNGIVQALMVLCDPGDAVVLPDPAWPNYEMMTHIVRADLVRYPLLPHAGFLPDLDALERICAATPRAKAMLVNSPSNPTGAVFDEATLRRILEIATRHDLYLITDESYEEIVFEGEHISPAALDDSGRVITVLSVSKGYSMTGWRIGYVAAAPELAATISKLQEAVTACASAVCQKAAQAAIEGDQACVAEMREAYRARRDRVAVMLEEAGLLLSVPHGAFYIMADTSSTGMDGYEFAKRLIVEHGVALAPGETFGPSGTGMVRISLATGLDDLEEGVARLTSAVDDWS
jgi:aspartate/methionine/tyrosine aminotransferase